MNSSLPFGRRFLVWMITCFQLDLKHFKTTRTLDLRVIEKSQEYFEKS